MKESNSKFPIIGHITVPVVLMNGEINDVNFQSGSAYCWGGDSTSSVSNDDGKNLDMIGGMMGGHLGFSIHPNDKKRFYGMIDVRDSWYAIKELLDTITKEDLQKINNKYEKKEILLAEIQQMQKEASILSILSAIKERKMNIEKQEKQEKETMKNGECIVIKDEWTPIIHEYLNVSDNLKYLTPEQNEWDLKKPIPLNWLTGIEFKTMWYDKINEYITIANRPYLTLEITTFRGAIGAVHYYGKLKLYGFDIQRKGESGTIFGFLGSDNIPSILELLDLCIPITKEVEEWEIEKDPDRYKAYKVGDRINAHWNKNSVIELGKEIHKKYFSEFKLKITK
jgi:hypothetical protein